MTTGISVSYGGLNLTTPAIVMPVSQQIGNMANSVTSYMGASEASPFTSNTGAAYQTANALMQNNANFQAMQNQSNANFNNTATNAMEYQANAIGHQGKKGG